MESIKKRNVILVALWGTVLFLTIYNATVVKKIRTFQVRGEILHKYESFFRNNARRIAWVWKKRDSLARETCSVDLGLLILEDQILSIARKYHLDRIRFNPVHDDSETEDTYKSVHVDISFIGSVPDVMNFLSTCKGRFSYLSLRRLKLKVDRFTGEALSEISFQCRFRIRDKKSPCQSTD